MPKGQTGVSQRNSIPGRVNSMGKGPEVRRIMALSRTSKTTVSGMHSWVGVSGKMVENEAEEGGWGQTSYLAISQLTPPGSSSPDRPWASCFRSLFCMCASSPASEHGREQGSPSSSYSTT